MSGQYLHNTTPGNNCVSTSATFTVSNDPYRLWSTGLAAGEFAIVEQRMSGTCVGSTAACIASDSDWTPVHRKGCPIVLSATSPDHIEYIPGQYRVTKVGFTPATQAAILAEPLTGWANRIVIGFSGDPQCNPTPCPVRAPRGVVAWGV